MQFWFLDPAVAAYRALRRFSQLLLVEDKSTFPTLGRSHDHAVDGSLQTFEQVREVLLDILRVCFQTPRDSVNRHRTLGEHFDEVFAKHP